MYLFVSCVSSNVFYLFLSLSLVVQLWIIKLTKQPPMYTAALARMFVGVLPMALLLHMAVACYMLGNVNILNVGFVTCVSICINNILRSYLNIVPPEDNSGILTVALTT